MQARIECSAVLPECAWRGIARISQASSQGDSLFELTCRGGFALSPLQSCIKVSAPNAPGNR